MNSTATLPLVRVEQAVVTFRSSRGEVRAVDEVDLSVEPGEIVAVVGESGCGKTTLARAILGLQPLDSGEIWLGDQRVRRAEPGLAQRVGMIWQDPFASLDPRWRIRRSLQEPLDLCGQKRDLAELAQSVGLAPEHLDRFPHQLSGGQRQRVAIGRALALRPPLVLCDEPTAALDLSIQAQILNLLKDLQAQTHCSYLYISHDLATVRFLADRVCVMFRGQIVEQGPTQAIFDHPRHPYTQALLDSAPRLDRLGILPMAPPEETLLANPACRYAPRCPFSDGERCLKEAPTLRQVDDRRVRCHFPR
ncbi:MAG TPA: ABC transporter ATP-binding protein [Fimbriimonadaceae bacterium]|nr:ABC transporter ATP-binding protein [Fimbriimonadaceae bacterium]HRJ33685.1 ABC transporter ATP-binding protein [Fimbriimonadaceae bacterium]